MDRRPNDVGAALVVGALALAAIGCSRPQAPPGEGAPARASGGGPAAALRALSPAPRAVLWVLRTEDCLSCRLPTRALRRLRHGAGIPLAVVVVGGGTDRVEAFLRAERLTVPVHALTEREYRLAFGRLPLPALYVVRPDTVVGVWTAADGVTVAAGENPESVLRRLIDAPGPARPAASAPLSQEVTHAQTH